MLGALHVSYKNHTIPPVKKKKKYYPYRTNEEQEAHSINNLLLNSQL